MDAGDRGSPVTNAAWATAKERSRKGTARELAGAVGLGLLWVEWSLSLPGQPRASSDGVAGVCVHHSREAVDGKVKLPTKMLQQPSAAKQTGRIKCRPSPGVPTKTNPSLAGPAHLVVVSRDHEGGRDTSNIRR